jgi:hypothetical protein
MTDTIVNFPAPKPDRKTVRGTLEYVLEMMKTGEAKPASMVIIWNEDEDNSLVMKYMVTNEASFAETIGLVELAKINIMSDGIE